MASRFLRLASLFLLFVAAIQRPAERVVAVGDVHGDLDRFSAILQKAGLIDASRQWVGGNATLVQTGDLVDRGPKSRAVLELLMTLEKDAPKRGGTVLANLGNHEVMNIMGDLQYVVAADYESFADSRSEQRRRTAFQSFSRLESRKGRAADEESWMKSHPLGFVEHREAFGPAGRYGKWLRGLPVVTRVDDSIFLHGGINPAIGLRSIDQINSAVKAEIQAFDKVTRYMVDRELALPFFTLEEFVRAADEEVEKNKASRQPDLTHIQVLEGLLQAANWLSLHSEGPLWFRGYNSWTEEEGEPRLQQLTQTFGIKRIVVAHTPQANGVIRQRFGGKVFLIDTGMVAGRPSALEISGGRIRALYMDRQTDFN
jgi:3',5'-cyclic AMP phosphodiesterase CpdA